MRRNKGQWYTVYTPTQRKTWQSEAEMLASLKPGQYAVKGVPMCVPLPPPEIRECGGGRS